MWRWSRRTSSISSVTTSERYPPTSITTSFRNKLNTPERMSRLFMDESPSRLATKARRDSTTWNAADDRQALEVHGVAQRQLELPTQPVEGAVGRAVVDDDDLVLRIVEGKDGPHGRGHVRLLVVSRNEDGDREGEVRLGDRFVVGVEILGEPPAHVEEGEDQKAEQYELERAEIDQDHQADHVDCGDEPLGCGERRHF